MIVHVSKKMVIIDNFIMFRYGLMQRNIYETIVSKLPAQKSNTKKIFMQKTLKKFIKEIM